MPNVETHAAGAFCWIELATTDQNAAKQFYGSLFGWTASDSPMGPNDFYTMFGLQGRHTGACYTLRPDMRAQGVPPRSSTGRYSAGRWTRGRIRPAT